MSPKRLTGPPVVIPTPPAGTYPGRCTLVHRSVAPLSAGDIRRLAHNLDLCGTPDAALVEVRTPIAGDRRKVDLAFWEADTTTTEGRSE